MEYASLHRRLLASVVDVLIIMILSVPSAMLINHLLDGGNTEALIDAYISSHSSTGVRFTDFIKYMHSQNAIIPYLLSQFFSFTMSGVYCVYFWASKGATLGKMLLRIKIVNSNTGNPITLKQSIVRFLGYVPSTLLFCIGFIMIHFRNDGRGLHDFIAGTAVVNIDKEDRKKS